MEHNAVISRVYEFMGLSQSCVYLLDEIELLTDEKGTFNLNLAIKEDISQKYDKKRAWFTQVLSRLVSLGFVTDLTLGRYRLNTDSEFNSFIEHLRNNPVKEITFEVKLNPQSGTKLFKIMSLEFVTPEPVQDIAKIA